MSRYRPPRPPSSPLITRAGRRRLAAELLDLWKNQRPEITERVAEAAAMGDRSENAAYIYGKQQLRKIDARIRHLERRLDMVQVVDRLPEDQTRVFFGAWVDLRDATGARHRHRIIGADETDPSGTFISVDAPLAKALLGRSSGDEVTVATPAGDHRWRIVGVHYDSFEMTATETTPEHRMSS